MQQIKHIFFDLDHTLWDFEKNSELTFKQIFKEQKVDINFDEFMRVYSPINVDYWKLFREEKISKETLRYKRLKDTFDKLNYKASDTFINQTAKDYLAYLPNYNNLIEGAIEILEYLHPKYSLHIITNGFKEIQSKKIKASNITKYFDIIVTSESVGVKKPNLKVFEFALQKAATTAKECVMIGDSYEADIMGAFNAGVLPIHLNSEQKSDTKGIVSIKSLIELKQYL